MSTLRLRVLPLFVVLAAVTPTVVRADVPNPNAARAEVRARIADLLDACDVYDASFQPGIRPPERTTEPVVISLREGETCQAVRHPDQGQVAITIVFGLLWALTIGVGIAGTFYLVRGIHGLFSASSRHFRARRV